MLESLKNANDIVKQYNKNNIIVTTSWVIARMTIKIQITESPTNDNIFINVEGFYVQMAF